MHLLSLLNLSNTFNEHSLSHLLEILKGVPCCLTSSKALKTQNQLKLIDEKKFPAISAQAIFVKPSFE